MVRAFAFRSAQWRQLCEVVSVEHKQLSFRELQKRCITTQDARGILGLSSTRALTPKTLRTAYLEAAKLCHPDTQGTITIKKTKEDIGEQFRLVTEAYEVLLDTNMSRSEDDYGITAEEEAEFRIACQTRLGVPAEIVEESKRCPIFRQWLDGRTDSAHSWKVFFMQYGGLAPKLRPRGGLIESGTTGVQPQSATRRRRPSQSTGL